MGQILTHFALGNLHKALQNVEKINKGLAHELLSHAPNLLKSNKIECWRDPSPRKGDLVLIRLAKGFRKQLAKFFAFCPDSWVLVWRNLNIEVAHNAVTEYPNEGFNIVFHVVRDWFPSGYLNQDFLRHELDGSL